jgi:hypothetical protein
MMLAAQRVIQEVEEEICLSVPRDTMNELRSHFYDTGDSCDVSGGSYLATISAIRMQGHDSSECTSSDSSDSQ